MVLGVPSTRFKISRPLVIDGPQSALVQLNMSCIRSALAAGVVPGMSRLIRFWLAVVPSAKLLMPMASLLSTKKRGRSGAAPYPCRR